MKKLIILMALIVTSSYAYYGKDGRIEYFQIKNQQLKIIADATAYQVERHYELRGWTFNRLWTIVTTPYRNQKICPSEVFTEQPSMRKNCTGILVAEDKLLTAGNCLTEHYCKNDLYYWMFDYNLKDQATFSVKRPRKNFYKCKEVIRRIYDPSTERSFALIRLNKKVKGRTPVRINFNSSLLKGDSVFVVGHMRGLPLKLDHSSSIIETNNNDYFVNSDLPGGYSKGAGVYDANTYKLEGIIVHGKKGYIASDNGCLEEEIQEDEMGAEYVHTLNALRPYL